MDQRIAQIGLDHPDVVQTSHNRGEVDQLVQLLPALGTDPSDGTVPRRCSQSGENNEGHHAT